MSEEKYQGWTNRETWAAALWLDNDEGLYNQSREIVREAVKREKEYPLTKAEDALKEFLDELKDGCYEEGNKELCKMFKDIGSTWRIDMRELTESRFDDDELKELKKKG